MKIKLLIAAASICVMSLAACSPQTAENISAETLVEVTETAHTEALREGFDLGFVDGYELAREDLAPIVIEDIPAYFTLTLTYKLGEPATYFSYSIAPFESYENCMLKMPDEVENIKKDNGFDIEHSCL